MSTDSTELTFIRCPSCRSLVPAVSTRCRMCGVTLEGQSSASEEKKSGRVRQHTMATPRGGAPITPVEEAKSAVISAPHISDEEEDLVEDPLKDYVEEIDDIQAKQEDLITHEDSEEEDPLFGDDEDDEDVITDDDFDDFLDEDLLEDDDDATLSSHTEEEPESLQAKVPQTEEPIKRDEKPLGIFSKVQESHETPRKEVSDIQEQPSKLFTAQNPQQTRSTEVPPISLKRSVDDLTGAGRTGSKIEVVLPEKAGRLYGWFVNNSNPEGSSYEIREGRFFISAGVVKGNDFIVRDSTISNPHAILTVSFSKGLTIQDLMSDNGVHVLKRGEKSFVRHEQEVSLSHGDVLRLGSVDLIVNVSAEVL